jgi:hypothetical protein
VPARIAAACTLFSRIRSDRRVDARPVPEKFSGCVIRSLCDDDFLRG